MSTQQLVLTSSQDHQPWTPERLNPHRKPQKTFGFYSREGFYCSSRSQVSSQSKRQHACWKRVVSYLAFVLLLCLKARDRAFPIQIGRIICFALSSRCRALFRHSKLHFLHRRGVAAGFWRSNFALVECLADICLLASNLYQFANTLM